MDLVIDDINENLQDVQQGNFFKYIDELKEIQDNNNLDKLNISTGNFSYDFQQTEESNTNGNKEYPSSETGLIVKIPYFDKRQLEPSDTNKLQINPEQSIINFGIVGQEVVIEKHKMYAFKLILTLLFDIFSVLLSSISSIDLLGANYLKCYKHIFEGCKKISEIKMLATNLEINTYYMDGWLNYVGTDESVTSRTLILDSQDAYDALKQNERDLLPHEEWQVGYSGTTVVDINGYAITNNR